MIAIGVRLNGIDCLFRQYNVFKLYNDKLYTRVATVFRREKIQVANQVSVEKSWVIVYCFETIYNKKIDWLCYFE